mmetsp:Transcript_32596/g.29452  ORF Transcript_32596/g.29452 Transcript_32596/m.29452 type:complete len:155 (+) Transcript_32596:317-781(+)
MRFKFYSSNIAVEDTNVRIMDSETNKTIVSFRAGFAGLVRVNENQIVSFYDETVLPEINEGSLDPIWTDVDLTMNWDDHVVNVYLNGTEMASTGFYYNEVEEADKVLLYNLSPGSKSYIRELEICDGYCDGFSSANILKASILSVLAVLFVSFL